MNACVPNVADFKKYFNENMTDLGLPVPSTIFDSIASAIASAALMLEAMSSLGPTATVAELLIATKNVEKLKLASTLLASYWVGAVVGSLAVATGRVIGCGTSLSDVIAFQSQHGLHFESSTMFYASNPEIFSRNHNNHAFTLRARARAGIAT